MRIFKLQINDNNGNNHVDKVLTDSRITAERLTDKILEFIETFINGIIG
ncbi:hypothetical protein Fluta_0319 [Fluviicola taffensis DSM 16823]|uniref:Uncharacterized protein n=1 Tax=Fluviicola taffensis (strain DSM 16823 / NCIMB 13979 / RW262) TaxID=755732 RepID=F2IDF2_FLUTR|nr:hypothetical protein Fluta_0319 [Fluviicola taffensis DSM 16823]